MKTIFFKSQDLHPSLDQETSDYFVAVYDSVHQESQCGMSPMFKKYVIAGEGQFFNDFIAEFYNPELHFVVTSHDNLTERKLGPVKEATPSSNPCCACKCKNTSENKKRSHPSSSSDEVSDQDQEKVAPPPGSNLEESSDPDFDPGTKSFTSANRGAKKRGKKENQKKAKKTDFSLLDKLDELPPLVRKSKNKTSKKKRKVMPTNSSDSSFDNE